MLFALASAMLSMTLICVMTLLLAAVRPESEGNAVGVYDIARASAVTMLIWVLAAGLQYLVKLS